jgi:signal transduction histidine kinase
MPTWASLLIGGVLLILVSVLDWMTGTQIALSLLYVIPITWMTWQGGRWLGLGMALLSGVCWLAAELAGHANYSNPLVPYWNGLIRTILFCLISALESEVIERKRVEQGLRGAKGELQEQTDILQSILNSMGDGVVVADSQGRLVHINPAARRILRMPSPDTDVVAWLESQESYPPDSLPEPARHENPLLRAVRGEAVDGAEMLLRHASLPAEIWLSVNSRPLVDPAGRIAGGVIVFSDISARKSLERQIAEVSDREQRRLGEDLHDGLCQHLVSIAFAARKLAARLAEQSLTQAEEATHIADLLGESIGQARSVARGLYLVPLEAGGLRSALEEFMMQAESRHRIACRFVEKVSVPIVDQTLVTVLFRIAQEAVTNALKHAQPKHITLTLSADAEQIGLAIEDDGAGFPPDPQPSRGMGLHLMNYRARMMGAALDIGPRPGGGTIVTCSVRRPNPAARAPAELSCLIFLRQEIRSV